MEWQTTIRQGVLWERLEADQHRCVAEVQKDPEKAHLLISEPSPTFTYGRSGSPTELLWGEEALNSMGISVHPVSRGGKWTYHGPGQIVVYPIVHLGRLGYGSRAVRHFLADLRNIVRHFLMESNVHCTERERPFGLYFSDKKLVSFGIAIYRGVCAHGFALYYSDQSASFSGISPCGMPNEQFTSLQALGVRGSWKEIAQQISETIKKGFKSKKNSIG